MRWVILLIGITGLELLAQPQPTVQAQTYLLAQKKRIAQKVLQQVGATYGFTLLQLPKLVVYARNKDKRKKNNHVARLELAPNTFQQATESLQRSRILIDEELIDICQAVDSSGSALAFVLSHEMAHFYRQHDTFRGFAEKTSSNKPAISNNLSLQQEQEADETGLLFAYLAGYDSGPVLNKVLDGIYAYYGISDPAPGYPNKADRQRRTDLHTPEFRDYGYLFAIGHMLYCREEFAEAARCFERVYTRYPLRESYLNFGTCRLQEVFRRRKKTTLNYFALPFEVDPRNRLLRLNERAEDTPLPVADLLAEADEAFRQAIAINKHYRIAYLHQAIGELLAEPTNPYGAMSTLQKLRVQTGPTLPPNAYLIEAIAQQSLGNRSQANKSFQTAVDRHAYQIPYNKKVFDAISRGTTHTLQRPWLGLRTERPDLTILGCQAGTSRLVEVDAVPATIRWMDSLLIEMREPEPFIVARYGQVGSVIYLEVDLRPQTLFFRFKR
ncbi:hypothetical protein GCM10028808_39580 [Spirosoma migulaei]